MINIYICQLIADINMDAFIEINQDLQSGLMERSRQIVDDGEDRVNMFEHIF